MSLVGFIIRNCHAAQSHERKILYHYVSDVCDHVFILALGTSW